MIAATPVTPHSVPTKEGNQSLLGRATAFFVFLFEKVMPANMLQPFWALPILAIAGIKMRRMMGFMVVVFSISAIVFGLSLLFLLPTS